jgi:hypothetical protein
MEEDPLIGILKKEITGVIYVERDMDPTND